MKIVRVFEVTKDFEIFYALENGNTYDTDDFVFALAQPHSEEYVIKYLWYGDFYNDEEASDFINEECDAEDYVRIFNRLWEQLS